MGKFFYGVTALVIIGAIAILWVLPSSELIANSTAEHAFEIEEPMQRVRKILVRTNAAKKIVAMANADLESQKWVGLDLDGKRPLRDQDWRLSGKGELQIVVHDAYLGDVPLLLEQNIEVEKDRLSVISTSRDTNAPIQNYRSKISLTPSASGSAQFECSLSLQVKTSANVLSRQVVSTGIEASALKALKQQEKAIREVVFEQEGKLIIVPDGIND